MRIVNIEYKNRMRIKKNREKEPQREILKREKRVKYLIALKRLMNTNTNRRVW